ncbi:hypothetical protein Q4F19_21025 [Sphingomonas sp. BIUV-7]|uniref:Uncharacterized protein n=1 Tax=Sphingomonas natans TaxID=3063330 RepID=A0ABT8YG97_9SPHN|nr:hypothetical protein [Sphingomonas sp. BIUV-7]MDO6416880.1 hypothetical protein [Sphingomonas sp. BIUV-7]
MIMSSDEIDRCLLLLLEAEATLQRNGENILAAHLSLITSRLRRRHVELAPLTH